MVRHIDLSGTNPDLYTFNFDAALLKQKYLDERNKRLNPKGNDQYIYIDENSRYRDMLKDPYVKPLERTAIQKRTTVLRGFKATATRRQLEVGSSKPDRSLPSSRLSLLSFVFSARRRLLRINDGSEAP